MHKTPVGKYFLAFALTALSFINHSCICTTQKPTSYLAFNIKDLPRSFDPREVRLLSDISLIKHLYEGLVQENHLTGDIELALAESYVVSDDGTTYTFRLKPTHWSNGEALTANDFIQSWKDIAAQKVHSIYAFALNYIQNVPQIQDGSASIDTIGLAQLDDYTIEIRLEQPLTHFLKLLALPVFYPVHHSLRNRSSCSSLVTNGAFTLSPTNDTCHLLLNKNPFYYEKDRIPTQEIKIFCIADPHTAALFFNQDVIHWQGPPFGKQIPKEILYKLKSKGKLCSADIAGTSWLAFNIHHFPFNNQKLRQALSLAIDLEALAQPLAFHEIKPTQHLLPQSIFSNVKTKLEQQVCADTAKQLFHEALLEMNLSIKDLEKYPIIFSNTSHINSLVAQNIQNQWKCTLGFTAPTLAKEFSILQSELTHKQFSLAISGWFADFLDPMTFFSVFAYPMGLSTYAIDDSFFSQLLHNIQKESDLEHRAEIIAEAAEYLEKQYIICPLYHEAFQFAKHKNLVDFHLSPIGIADFRYAKIQP